VEWPGDADAQNRLSLSLMAGTAQFDLVNFYAGELYTYMTAGLLQDLNEFPELREAFDNPNLMGGVKNSCTYIDGTLFGVVSYVYYNSYVVNRALFEKLRLDIPDVSWSYDDYYQLALSIQDKALAGEAYLCTWYNDSPFQKPDHATTSRNGYQPAFNTSEYIEWVRKTAEIPKSLLWVDREMPSQERMTFVNGDNILLWQGAFSDIFLYTMPESMDYKKTFSDEVYQNTVVLPWPEYWPTDSNGNYLCMTTNANNTNMAKDFLLAFLDEDYQRENAVQIALYKDLTRYNRLGALPDSLKRLIENQMTRETENLFLLGMWDYVDNEVDFRYASGEWSIEDCANALQREAEKRMNG